MNTSARPRFRSARTAEFTESVIRDMTRQAIGAGAVNLAQGFPDFPAPEWLKTAAAEAIAADHNQYPITWGIPPLRQVIADKTRRHYGLEIDPAREITVVCGATEGMAAVLLGWMVLFGVAVSGLVFAVAFVCWFIDKCRKEWDL